eukprot:1149498-Pelagomonas_calceolata.AAC.2
MEPCHLTPVPPICTPPDRSSNSSCCQIWPPAALWCTRPFALLPAAAVALSPPAMDPFHATHPWIHETISHMYPFYPALHGAASSF